MGVARLSFPLLSLSTPRAVEEVERSTPLDVALVTRMAAGDQQAMETFYSRWEDVVREALFLRESDTAREDDLLAEVFWQAWCGASRFDGARGSVKTWLLMLTRMTCVMRCRHVAQGDDRHGAW